MAIREERPASLGAIRNGFPAVLDELVLDGCLAKDPAFRPSLAEVSRALADLDPTGIVLHSRESVCFPFASRLAEQLGLFQKPEIPQS